MSAEDVMLAEDVMSAEDVRISTWVGTHQEAKGGRQTVLSTPQASLYLGCGWKFCPLGGRPSPSVSPAWKCPHKPAQGHAF